MPRPQTVEFSLDNVANLQHHGFTVEPSKGFVERGQTKTISISWMPPDDFDVGAGGRGHRVSWAMQQLDSSAAGCRARWLSAPRLPFQPDHPLTVSALLQLKGDVKETYKVFFVAQVVTGL